MARNQKERVSVDLPSAFVDFMRHVKRLIDAGDDATQIESDDLLQCDQVYGGLYDPAGGRFAFRYFHGEGERETWDFDLDDEQIAAIARGALQRVELWRCPGGGCNSLHSKEDSYCSRCDSVRHFDDYASRLRVWRPDEDDATIAAMENLRKIGLAILAYHREHNCFPTAYTSDSDGRPMHSWRSLILPYLDCDELFEDIRFEEPWDSDANRAVWDRRPDAYRCEDVAASQTNSVAVVGKDTIWPPGRSRAISDIMSGTSYTVAAIQSKTTIVNWMQPADIDLDAAVAEYASLHSMVAVFVDGHVDLIDDKKIERLRELICI